MQTTNIASWCIHCFCHHGFPAENALPQVGAKVLRFYRGAPYFRQSRTPSMNGSEKIKSEQRMEERSWCSTSMEQSDSTVAIKLRFDLQATFGYVAAMRLVRYAQIRAERMALRISLQKLVPSVRHIISTGMHVSAYRSTHVLLVATSVLVPPNFSYSAINTSASSGSIWSRSRHSSQLRSRL